MNQNEPFQNIVNALLDESKPFPARFLNRFSDLPPNDLELLMQAWTRISPPRKQTLLDDLENLSETDTLTFFKNLALPLIHDSDPIVRTRAIRLLWECDDKDLIPIYLKLLNTDDDVEVQAAAANALGQFVYLGELGKILSDLQHEIEEHLLAATAPPKNTLVRRRSLESLGYSGREEVIPLIETAFQDKNPDWIVSALFAMGRSSDDRWKKHILSHLTSQNEDIRSEAVHAAGELEIESASPILLDLLEDEDDLEILHELIWALSRIGGEGVRAKLEELLDIEEDDEEADFIQEALDTLSFTEDMGNFDLIDVDPEIEFIEEEPDDEK
jgi:HEAT repeat protein